MRAVAILRAGPPETLEAIDAPDPSPGPGRILIRVHLRIFHRHPELGSLLLRRSFDLAASGKAKPVIAAEIPLDKAWEAHRLLESRATVGKVLLAVRD